MKPMVYIIQDHMIWILYNDCKFREYLIPKYFPSWRKEPRRGTVVCRRLGRQHFILKNRCSEECWKPITIIKIINKQTNNYDTHSCAVLWLASLMSQGCDRKLGMCGGWEQQFREYNVSDIDNFHGYLIEQTIESKNN